MTPRDLIKSSLRLIGVLASGETPTSDQSNDALDSLNAMISSLSIDGFMVYKVDREEFTLAASQASRTMGSGGNFSTTRPTEVVRVTVKSGSIELPVDMVTVEQWAAITDKSTVSSYPWKTYIEGTYPLETFNFYPTPSASSTVVIYSLKPIASTLALSDTLSMPNGYEDFLKYALGIRLAPEYGRQIDPTIMARTDELKATIIRKNTRPVYMQNDAPVKKRRYHFTRGW